MDPKYPKIVVQLAGCNGNAFFIIGKVRQALKRGKVPETKLEEFTTESQSGDYDNVLQTAMRWVTVI